MPGPEPMQNHEMLTLALISYRGYHLTLPEEEKRRRLRQAMTAGLESLAPVRERWDIVWGPASYRLPFGLFDDAAMYVARSRARPGRLAVAVRGTNPISLFDWLFGDLAVSRLVPWPYSPGDAPEARVSFSTALGLRILQHLRSEPAPTGLATASPPQPEAGPRPLGTAASGLLRQLRGQIQSGHEALRQVHEPLAPEALESWVTALRARIGAPAHGAVLAAIDQAASALGETRLDPLRLLLGGSELRRARSPGLDLGGFLAAAVSEARGEVEVFVTGHSKGGALSTALALWLADTQGDRVAEEDRWDPERKATVHAYSFAGPTAGNGAFARHSEARLGRRCHRIVNQLDIVPHAWSAADLRQVAFLYGPAVVDSALVGPLARELAERVAPLDYQHPGGDVTTLPGAIDPGKRLLAMQAAHQHLDGYLQQMGLGDEMSALTFFSPLG